jgi:hypothetical protein
MTLSCTLGLFFGARLGKNNEAYHGLIVVEESETGLVYRIVLASDPEQLMYEDAVSFKVVSPDYIALLDDESRSKLGV